MKYLVSLLVAGVIILGAAEYYLVTRPVASFGSASAGPYFSNFLQFGGGHTDIDRVNASSTKASVTLTGSEFLNYDQLDYTINNAAGDTLTLPASTTPMCSSLGVGERRTIMIRNASTTAENLTIAGGTGFLLKSASTTNVIDGTTDGSAFGVLQIIRTPNTNCSALLMSFD